MWSTLGSWVMIYAQEKIADGARCMKKEDTNSSAKLVSEMIPRGMRLRHCNI